MLVVRVPRGGAPVSVVAFSNYVLHGFRCDIGAFGVRCQVSAFNIGPLRVLDVGCLRVTGAALIVGTKRGWTWWGRSLAESFGDCMWSNSLALQTDGQESET